MELPLTNYAYEAYLKSNSFQLKDTQKNFTTFEEQLLLFNNRFSEVV